MKTKTYKIAPTTEDEFALYEGEQVVVTGDRPTVVLARDRRIRSTLTAIRQHGGEPQVEVNDHDDIEIITIRWEPVPPSELRCLKLPPASWQRLEALAQDTESMAKTGPYHGSPSWRTLIRRIADGELQIVQPEQETKKHPRP